MAETRQLTVRGRYDCIPTVTSFVGEAAEAAGLNEDEMFHCKMAVDEACTNVIEHAYGGEDVGAIEVKCTIEPGNCVIEIIDHGQPFNPDSVPTPQFSSNIEDIQPGGIGLHLMKQMMDDVRFEFEGDRNTLIMVKSSRDAAPIPTVAGMPVRQADGEVWVLLPQGRLDAATAPQLEEALSEMLGHGQIWLVVDMQHVAYIASRGLKTLVSAWRRAGDAGGNLVLAGMGPRVAEIFDTVGFSHIFDIYASQEDAVTALAHRKG